jgi:hypothetical protein
VHCLNALWIVKKEPKTAFPYSTGSFIKSAIKYLTVVIPAKAGIQVVNGCRIKSGTTEHRLFCRRINK